MEKLTTNWISSSFLMPCAQLDELRGERPLLAERLMSLLDDAQLEPYTGACEDYRPMVNSKALRIRGCHCRR